jgi:hypothetical protein
MIIRNKFNGYSGDGRRLYPLGGGGGTTQSYTHNIPEYAQPYVERMLGATENQIFQKDEKGDITGFQPFKSFRQTQEEAGLSGESVAGFSPMQQQAMQGLANYQMPGQTGAASAMASDLAGRALQAGQYTPGYSSRGFGNQFTSPDAYQAGVFTPQALQQYQMGGPQQVGTGTFTQAGTAEAYMSPYQQAVTDIEKREAQRASAIQGKENRLRSMMQGSFGGSRGAQIEAERQRNLGQQLSDIQARGGQSAFQQAQQQYNAEQQARLQAALANQQAGLTTEQQNLAARLGVQQLGAEQGMQAQQLREQSRQFGYGQGMTAAQLRAQYGLAGQQLGEQSRQFAEQARQFGANLGMQGIESARASAGLLGNLGQQQYAQEMGLMGQQFDIGSKEQAYEQARLNQIIQDYATQQQYPFIQMGTLSNMLRGLPMQASTTQMYQAQPSFIQQGIGALGAFNQAQQAGMFRKKGGVVKEMSGGGIASGVNPNKLPSMMEKLSDDQLKGKLQPENSDPQTLGIAQAEKQRRDRVRGGMANGGVIAFKEGNKVDEVDNPFETKAKNEIKTEEAKPAPAPKPAPKPAPRQAAALAQPEIFEQVTQKGLTAPSTEHLQPLIEQQTRLRREANLGVEGQLERRQAMYDKYGVDPLALINKHKEEQNALLEQAKGDAKKAEHLRYAQMWAKFGSTPGPIIRAACVAIDEGVPDLLDDQEKARTIQNNIRKVIFDLDKAEYLEKKNKIDEAEKKHDSAISKLAEVEIALTNNLVKQETARFEVAGKLTQEKMGNISAQKVAAIRESGEKSRADTSERRLELQERREQDRRQENEQKEIGHHTDRVNRGLSEFDKQNKDEVTQAQSVLRVKGAKPEAKEMAKRTLDDINEKRRALEAQLLDMYPKARAGGAPTTKAPAVDLSKWGEPQVVTNK